MSMRRQKQQIREQAFARIVEAYEGRLLRYAATILRNEELAQDVVQDVFIRLFRKWREPFAPGAAMSSWLFRTAHNRAVDIIRKHERRQHLEEAYQEQQPEPIARPAVMGGREEALGARVQAALHQLKPRERELVLLKVFEEKSYKEIHDITGLSTGNVGYILHHAMRKLAEELGRTDE